jgi:thiol-disulfide isomerase/thioredoxin
MTSIPLGPLALPTAPLLVLVASLLATWLADRWTAPAPGARRAGGVLTQAVLLALLAARLAHVLQHADAYGAEPLLVLDLRDGGWHAAAGVAAGLGWVAWQAWRQAAWRRALAAGAAAGLVLWGAGSAMLQALAPVALPNLNVTDLASGQTVALPTVAPGRPVVLNLWATWCGPCRREMPMLAAAQARHPGVAFVFVNQGESADTVRRHLATEGLALDRVLLDRPSALGPALGSGGLPTTVFFDAQGRHAGAHMGLLNRAALDARVHALQAH